MTSEGLEHPSVVVVGAHAFDAEAMAGGWCASLASAGSRVILVHLSDGERGHPSLSAREYASQKQEEAGRAAEALGAEAVLLHLPDTQLASTQEVDEQVARIIREVRPQITIGHWRGSWHRDHRAAHDVYVNGLFLASLPSPEQELPPTVPSSILFAENWEDADMFIPSISKDITPGFDRWVAAIDEYELCHGDISSFPYRDYYLSLARLRGCLGGSRYAESFMSISREWAAGLGIFGPRRPLS